MPKLTIIFSNGEPEIFNGDIAPFSFVVVFGALKVTVGRNYYYYPLSSMHHFTFEEK